MNDKKGKKRDREESELLRNAKDKEGFVVFAVVVHDVCRCCCCCSLKRGDTLLLARVRICHSTVLLARHLVHLHLAHLYPARHHDMPHHPPTYCCTPSYIYMWVSYGDAILGVTRINYQQRTVCQYAHRAAVKSV